MHHSSLSHTTYVETNDENRLNLIHQNVSYFLFFSKHSFLIFTARKRSCSKVMFLHLSVSHFIHRGGVYPSMQWAGV